MGIFKNIIYREPIILIFLPVFFFSCFANRIQITNIGSPAIPSELFDVENYQNANSNAEIGDQEIFYTFSGLGRNLEEQEGEICHLPYEYEQDGDCVHKDVFPLTVSEIIGIFFLFLCMAAAIAGGIGIKYF
jgi:hypothetical protein